VLQSTGKFLFDDLFARAQKETNLREMNQIQQEKVFKFAAAVFRLLKDREPDVIIDLIILAMPKLGEPHAKCSLLPTGLPVISSWSEANIKMLCEDMKHSGTIQQMALDQKKIIAKANIAEREAGSDSKVKAAAGKAAKFKAKRKAKAKAKADAAGDSDFERELDPRAVEDKNTSETLEEAAGGLSYVPIIWPHLKVWGASSSHDPNYIPQK
jgi:hypothetical protein